MWEPKWGAGGKGVSAWHWIPGGHNTALTGPHYTYFEFNPHTGAVNEIMCKMGSWKANYFRGSQETPW